MTQKKTSRRKKHPIEKIRISTPLHWTRPYIRRAIDKMPGLHLPTYVRSFKPTKTKLMRNLGNCYFDTKTLSIATHDQVLIKVKGNTYKVSRIVVLPRKKVLETIAHELAHLHYEDHGYEQDEFTKIIFKAFAFMEKCPICGGKGKVVADC